MDQEKGAGHHVITKTAVHNLYASGRAEKGRVVGLPEEDFYHLLDGSQEHMDRWWGPTIRPFWMDEEDQREHGMAAGNLTGEENIERNKAWVEDNTVQAVIAMHNGKSKEAMKDLGAAVHALEDSYSEAHGFRDKTAHSGNPDAKIESFNTFDPTGISGGGGVFGVEGTHDPGFDKVPVSESGDVLLGTDKAAVNAVTELLEAFVDQQDARIDSAKKALDKAISKFFQSEPGGPVVNLHPDSNWKAERDGRKIISEMEVAAVDPKEPPIPAAIGFYGELAFDPNPPTGDTAFNISWQEMNNGGPGEAYKTLISYYDEAESGNSFNLELCHDGLGSFDTADRTQTIHSGIPAGSKWRFELTLDMPTSVRHGPEHLKGEIEAVG